MHTQDEATIDGAAAAATIPTHAVAVIGMAGVFPKAESVDELWKNLCDGVEGITFFTDDELRAEGISEETLADPHYVKGRGWLSGADRFDPAFFSYSIRGAELMDPQHRLFLEKCWEALEMAGYDPTTYEGSVGVYGGASFPTYLFHHWFEDKQRLEGFDPWHVRLFNENDYLTTNVSYRMGLRGPSLNVQTACSTSLVAVHVAVQALLNGECSIALAGGASISTPGRRGYKYEKGFILSPDGHCRAFDAAAGGTVEGEGVGIVALKRLDRALEDGDNVLAMILATAVNNDGQLKVGFTAPGVDGQAEVITEAQAVAGVSPDTITYVEAHGTGTELGDPIEIAALKQVFRAGSDRVGWCAVGALKTSIGHLDAAAGVSGLIKTVQALRHRQIPPTLHFKSANPRLELEGSPFVIADQLRDWTVPGGAPRRAGVSSFGIGGTNAHAVLEEAPARPPSGHARPWQLLVLSARSPAALERATENLVRWLEAHPDAGLGDVAYTLQAGRRPWKHRRTLVARDGADAVATLRTRDPDRVRTAIDPHRMVPAVYLFPGQGAQFVGMAREAYAEEGVFREHFDRCCDLFAPHLGLDLRDVVFPAAGRSDEADARLRQTALTQPALFAVEYALARLWMHWGVAPEAMIGHSIGEYVAAAVAGVFSLEDAARVVAARGALMQEMPAGSMLSVSLPEAEVRAALPPGLEVAVVNGPALTVVGGEAEPVEAFAAEMERRGVHVQRLHTSHAFHTRLMDGAVARLEEVVRSATLHRPEIPFLSNVTGGWITDEQARDPGYWAAHLRAMVRFDDGLRELMREPDRILLEVGPGRGLATLARRHPAKDAAMLVLHSLPHVQDDAGDTQTLWAAMGELWLVGLEPRWPQFYTGQRRYRLPLPTYPFEKGRFWLGRRDEESVAAFKADEEFVFTPPQYVGPRSDYEAIVCEIWKDLFGRDQVGIYDNFFNLGGDSLIAIQVTSRIRERVGVEVPLRQIFEVRTPAQIALLIAEHREAQGVEADAIAPADRGQAPEYRGEVDLGVAELSDAEVAALLAELADEQELPA
ncbi:MAG TPA: beta-ketoacyl synthase N-terminal-like domain-containing protein [Longimicrobium sp.]|nr:beta-ketoacyl synthase N-terminal-like domain-containing protein [Longimicrobium sp.]